MLFETQICDEKGSASAELQEKVPGPGLFFSLLSQCNVLLCFDFGPLKGAGHQPELTNTQLTAEQSPLFTLFFIYFFFFPFPAHSQKRLSRFLPFLWDGNVSFLSSRPFLPDKAQAVAPSPTNFSGAGPVGADGVRGGAKRRRLSLVGDIPLLQNPAVRWPWVPQHHVGCW